MRRKQPPRSEPVIDQKLLEEAKRAIVADQLKRVDKCSVCGAACAPNAEEPLCWVCRRLKISAWRDSDQQIAQE
jgi:methionyl-tRNA synthetase